MATELFFNYWGRSYSLFLELVDSDGVVNVWRAEVSEGTVVDTVFFECDFDTDVVELMNCAIGAWVDFADD